MKHFSLSFSIFIVLIIGTCNPDLHQEDQYLSLENDSIDSKHIIRRINNFTEDVSSWADTICTNNIYFHKGWGPYSYKDSIDWTIDPYKNVSWVFYFQSLRMLGYLAYSYELDPKPKYLEKGIEIINSWNEQHITEDGINTSYKKAWGDVETANRVLNLFHFYAVTFDELDNKTKSIIHELLYKNGEWLSKDENYTHGNHAIMQNRALLLLSFNFKFPEKKEWQTISENRMEEIIEASVTSEGVCVENSSFYHIHVMNLLRNSIRMYENNNHEVPPKFYENLEKMKEFACYMIKPNNTLPTIGDTNYSDTYYRFEENSSEILNFVDSRGQKGTQPPQLDVVFPKSGYAILREYWGTVDSFINATHFMLTTANLSGIHKHSDILSFELYSNGEELIVDGGHYGYKRGELRNYFKTTFAHNTLTVDDKNYHVSNIIKSFAKISNFNSTDSTSLIECVYQPFDKKGINKLQYHRTVYYLKPNIIILHDSVSGLQDESKFQQLFHFGKNLSTLKKKGNELEIQFKNTTLKIVQLEAEDEFNIFEGESGLRGTVANGQLKTRFTKQLEYVKHIDSESESFVTILEIQKNSEVNSKANEINIDHLEIKKVDQKLEIYHKDKLVEF